jgi:hypothetical protein
MPLIEFVGYSRDEAVARMERYKPLFDGSGYEKDVIFVIDAGSELFGEPPFLRVRSRYVERLQEAVELLKRHESVEYFQISFQPKVQSLKEA